MSELPNNDLTEKEALDILWRNKDWEWRKNPENQEEFLWAVLKEPVEMRVWNGQHPVEKNETFHTAPAGTKVLVTVASRFGDVVVEEVEPGICRISAK